MRLDARVLRGVILLAFLLIAAGILLRHLAPQADTLTGWMDRYLPGGYVGGAVYVCSVAGLICLAVPRQLLSFAGGYAFGALPGALLSTLGVTLGCVLAFGLSRYAGRSFVERRYGDKAEAFNRIVVKRPFVLALLICVEVIGKVPATLHTPLMSGANSIHGIVIAGVVIVAAHATSPLAWVFIFLAAVLGTMNVVGGYVVTDRMLEMFKSDKGKKKEEEAK